jgi:hypothetical protein
MADSGQQRKSLIQKSSSDPFKRKSDPEQCAAGLFFRPQLPLVHFHNGSRDGQPHAHAFGLAGEKRFGPALACSPGALLRPPYGLAPTPVPACAVAPVCAARRLSVARCLPRVPSR